MAQERGDNFLAKVKEVQGEHQLDQKTLNHLLKMLERGDIKAGVPGFGDNGMDNGLFYGELRTETAPASGASRRVPFEACFWNKGRERETYSEQSLVACSRARFPLIIQDDSPGTVSGVGLRIACARNITRYGIIGGKIGTGLFELTDEFVEQ